MRFRRTAAAIFGAVILVGPLSGQGAAATGRPTPAGAGVSVDLRQGWGKFDACLIKPGGEVECFDNAKAMKARSQRIAMTEAASSPSTMVAGSASTWCPIYLYSGANYTGRVLGLSGRGYWMNLGDYGFDNQAVSFYGSGCGFHLADYAWGGGWWFPGNTGPYAYAGDMGPWGWNWRVSSAYIS